MDRIRRIASTLVGLWFLFIVASNVYRAYQGKTSVVAAVVISLSLGTLAIGLFFMNHYARRVTAALFIFFITIMPIGYINPFNAMDDLGPNPPNVSSIVLWMVPLEVALLALSWLIDPPRRKQLPKTEPNQLS
jgi:hypothetical protein